MPTAKWPDLTITHEDNPILGQIVRAATNTGRPKTPIFTMMSTVPRGMTEKEAEELIRQQMNDAYERAHPNGCPKRRAQDSNPSAVNAVTVSNRSPDLQGSPS